MTWNEPPHDKTNKMACVHSEDSDQPGHPPSLIRVFTVHMKKAWVLSYPLSAQRSLIRLGRCQCWSLLGAQSFCWFSHEAAQILYCRWICGFVVRIWQKQVFSWRGSIVLDNKACTCVLHMRNAYVTKCIYQDVNVLTWISIWSKVE